MTGLVASDFIARTGATGLPDFSSSGGPITFGIQRSNTNSNPAGGGAYTTTNGLDNFNQDPAPAAVWLLGTGLLGLAIRTRALEFRGRRG